jgi:SH3-like domain-containing protein
MRATRPLPRNLSFPLAAALVLAVATTAVADDVVPGRELRTLAGDVVLHAAPTMAAGATARVAREMSVAVLERRGEWVRVRAASREGWVREDHLVPTTRVARGGAPRPVVVTERTASSALTLDGATSQEPRTVEVVPRTGALVRFEADLRDVPAAVAVNVGNVRAGDRVTVLGREGRWLLVRGRDGAEGWIDAAVVATVVPSASPTPAGYRPVVGDEIAVSRALFLRDRPSHLALASMPLRAGEPARILARHGEWLYVRAGDGTYGWITEGGVLDGFR